MTKMQGPKALISVRPPQKLPTASERRGIWMWPRGRKHFLEASLSHPEEVLLGGLETGRVVKVGETVRREAGPWTPTIQTVLTHLNRAGFPCPRPLGLDEQGRESFSFLPGRASNWPWPTALIATDGAAKVGTFLRAYHRVVAGFAPPAPALWRHGPQEPKPGEVILHGDFGPHNLIWDGEDICGLIDFELARPGDPMEDAGFAVVRAAQLRPDAQTRPPGFARPPDRAARLAAFAEGYGCARSDLVDAARLAQRSEIERIARYGAAGLEPWATFRRRGIEALAHQELAWIETNAGALL
jgi:Phosphotransferase enzyme family